MGRACNTNGKKRNAYRILVGKPEGRRPLGRPRRRWVNNIKMYLREIGWDGIDWIDLAQDGDQWRALVNMVMNLYNFDDLLFERSEAFQREAHLRHDTSI
jgi:hypothetical protein